MGSLQVVLAGGPARFDVRAWALAALVWLSLACSAYALDVPPFRAHVNDLAGLLSQDARAALEHKLASYEQSTGQQFALLIIPSLEGEPLEDYSIKVAEQWKAGDKAEDNGLIMLVVPNDRKMRIEVGYGLEGSIPDALASRVVREVMQPSFRFGDFAGGIDRAFDVLIAQARGENPLPPKRKARHQGSPLLLLFVLFFVFMLLNNRFGKGRRRGGYYGGWGGGGFGGFGGGGGGWGGGGGGGFGGGGGGGFGGGGASGDW